MSSVPLRTLVGWSPTWLLLVGLLLVPTTAQAQVEIDGIVKDYSDLNPGDTGTANVTIENVGTATVDAFLTLEVPTDVIQLDEVTPSAGSCTQEGTDTVRVECTFDNLASTSSREVDVVMTATDSLGGSTIDVASGRQGQTEPDDEALIGVTVLSPGEADLALDCTTEADTLTVGAEVTYACTVTNTTSTDSTGAKKIKEKAFDLAMSAYASEGNAEFTSATTETGECSVGQNALCRREMLDEGEMWPFEFTVIWPEPGPTTIKAGVGANTEDPNFENNNDELNRTAVEQAGSADLTVALTDDGSPPAGGLHPLEATVGNNGPDAAGTVELTVDLPGDVFTPITVEVLSGSGNTDCETESSGAMETTTCIMTDMQPDEERRVAVDTKVAEDAGGNDVAIAATTQTGSSTGDPDGGNNDDEITHTVEETPVADLTVSKSARKRFLEAENLLRIKLPFVVPGDTLDFFLNVKNEGSAPATGVKLFDNPPLSTLANLGPAFEIVWDQIDSDCADAFTPSGTGARLIECELGEIAPGDSVLVIIPMTVHNDVEGQVVNGVEVWSQTPEENTQNNTDELTMRAVDGRLRVRKEEVTPIEAPELLNSEVEYKIEVENTSSIAAQNVEMTDELPDKLDVIPRSIEHNFDACSVAGAEIVCNRATLAPGDTATVRYAAVITAPGQFKNFADASSDNLPGLRRTHEDANISVEAQLRVVPELKEVEVGETDAVTTIIENTGDTDIATRIRVEADEAVPLVAPLPGDGECRLNEANNTARCASRTKAGGESRFTVPFSGNQLGTHEVDVTLAGVTKTATVNVVEEASDLDITKTADTPRPVVRHFLGVEEPDTTFTYTITVESAEDRSVTLVDDYDEDDLYLYGLLPVPECETETVDDNARVLCDLSLKAGQPQEVHLEVEPLQGGEVINRAYIRETGDEASATVQVQALDVEVTPAETETVVGTDVTYTVAVTNTGTEPAPNVLLGSGFLLNAPPDSIVGAARYFRHSSNSLDCPVTQLGTGLGIRCELGTLAPGEERTIDVTGYFLKETENSEIRATAISDDERADEDFTLISSRPGDFDAQVANIALNDGNGKQVAVFDLYVDSTRVVDDLAAGDATAFAPTSIGRTTVPVQVVPGNAPDNSDPLLATEADLLGAEPPIPSSHSFIITGTPAAPILTFKRGARQEAQDPAKVDLFVAQGASPTASSDSSATVRLADPKAGKTVAVLADSLAAGSASAYVSIDPGEYLLEVVGTNTETVLNSSKLDLSSQAGEALSLILAGSLDEGVEVFPVGADPASSLAPLQPSTVDATVDRTFGDASSDQDYALVALPGAVDMPLAQTLDGVPGTEWQAFWDDGSEEDYLIAFDGSETFTFRPGGGFWLISTAPWSVDATIQTVTLQSDSVTTVPLHEGWNIISNPLSLDVPWNEVDAANPGPLQSPWRWDGAFSVADTFRAATDGGAFYFLNDAGLDELAVPYPGVFSVDTSAAKQGAARPALALTVQQDERRTSQIRVGTHPDAEEGIDAFDQFAPPARFETTSLRLLSPAANSSVRRSYLGVDVRPEVRTGRVFDLVLKSPPGVPVELEARGLVAVGGRAAALINTASGRSYELGKTSPITLTSRDSSTALELAIGPRSFVEDQQQRALPDEVELTSYPNPVERQATVEYALPAASRVRLALYDVLGRKVRTVVDAKRRAGRHRVRLDVGTLASGMYLGRLEANGKTRTHEIVVVR